MEEFKVAPIKPSIPFSVFDQIDVRVGTIESVEDIRGSEKLVGLVVNFGDRKRYAIVGMKKERRNPKEIEGRQALFVLNLEQRRIMGKVSEAMLFDIGYQDGIVPVMAVPEKHVPDGARLG